MNYLFNAGPLSHADLGDYMSIRGSTTVRLVDRLVRDGWVVREANPKDGRVKLLVPTNKATDLWGEVSSFGQEVLDEAYQGIGPADIELVQRILEKARKNLDAEV